MAPDDGGDCAATGDAQVGAVLEGGRLDPAVRVLVPEQVAARGADDGRATCGPDPEVIAVRVVVDQDRGDRLGGGLARLGVVSSLPGWTYRSGRRRPRRRRRVLDPPGSKCYA